MQPDPESSSGSSIQTIQPNNNNTDNRVIYLDEEDLSDNYSINLDEGSESDFQPDRSLLGDAHDNNGDEPDTTTTGRFKRYFIILFPKL